MIEKGGTRASRRESFSLQSTRFRREREKGWRELEELVGRVESRGLTSLSAEELVELPSLYRSAVSSYSVARAISLDRNLLEYLGALVGRAYVCIYGTRQGFAEEVKRFFRFGFPEAVRASSSFVVGAIVTLCLGILAGYLLTGVDPERYYSFVDAGMAQGRTPASATEDLRRSLYAEEEDMGATLHLFATFLFTNNAKIGILCFALGFAAGVPVALLLFYNGLVVGAMAALFSSRDLGAEFWAWVLPHGITELLAVCLCGAAGMVLGAAVVFPGEHTRLENLALQGRRAARLAIGAVVLFFLAALIEGFFRQLVQDISVRWGVAVLTVVFWVWYLGLSGVSRGEGR